MLEDVRTDFTVLVQVLSAGLSPVDPDAAPTFRVYGESSLLGNGTATQAVAGSIGGVTNANPAVVNAPAHGLTSGTVVTVAGVLGATGANGSSPVTVVDPDHFSVPRAAGGAYTSGGAWAVTGLWAALVDTSIRTQMEPGRAYTLIADYAVSAVLRVDVTRFNAA